MSEALRYKNPVICEHLASQYVAGVMTPRVRARTEALSLTCPELSRAIAEWAETLSPIHDSLEEITPSPKVWEKIERSVFEKTEQKVEKSSVWSSLRFWQFTGIGASALSLTFAALLFFYPASSMKEPIVSATPSYLAVMSPASADDSNSAISFVVNVYQKTETSPSRLFLQWSENSPRGLKQGIHLWAKHRETGLLTYIGSEPNKATPWNLNKSTWTAVSNSSELVFTKNADSPSEENTLFTGPCIQLGSWKHDLNS
ncbi:hypothetical protein OFY17_09895 [Marinomonas sp. C2222]|uniref:Anti-sigma-K factor rskA n=1 Tax=Marinomonas sargassi TaxID=2984494 RepID=A0ABT2YTG3_9GAMM|nr:hypothetical protein [Marinomonas sargassi]MCV2403189.1 hypothetical protein [Marinomonas sargassi]